MQEPVSLTAAELRSLRGLTIPRSLKSESLQGQRRDENYGRSTDTLPTEKSPPPYSPVFCNEPIPLLVGTTVSRHSLNPKVILVVGEFVSFAHLPGVGTRWQIGNQRGTSIQRRCLYRQLWWLIYAILLPTHAHKEWVCRWREFVLPYPPPPRLSRPSIEHFRSIVSPEIAKILYYS